MSISEAISINDLREAAKKRLPRMVFDYIDGGADDEITLKANTSRIRELELIWNVLVDVTNIDTKTKILGKESALPFFIAPTASSRLFNPIGGESAVVNAAQKYGIPYSAATLGATKIETIAQMANIPKFFQIYVWKDRGLIKEIIARAKDANYDAIILTVDTPVAGNRERDPRNKFSVPPKLNLSLAMQSALKFNYMWDLATSPKISAANFENIVLKDSGIIDFINNQFDRSVSWKDAQWMREQWDGKFAIKGVANPNDAQKCLDIGADAIWISNHGGRQLDTGCATIDLLPKIAQIINKRAEIIMDSGIRRGTDIIKSLALGADSVAIGRAYLYGLAAGGQIGVEKALSILKEETLRAMALCGVQNISQISEDLIANSSLKNRG